MNRTLNALFCAAALAALAGGLPACPPPPVKVAVVYDLLKRFPGEAFLYCKLGEFENEQQHWAEAGRAFSQAEALDPTWTDTYFYKGIYGLESGDMAVAAAATQRFFGLPDIAQRRAERIEAITAVFTDPLVKEILGESRPNLEQAKAAEARALSALGRGAEADRIFSELAQQYPSADYVLGRARGLEAAGRPEEALRVLNSGLAVLGSLPVLEDEALKLEEACKHYSSALGRLERLCRSPLLRPQRLEAQARILKESGRLEEAKAKARLAAKELALQPPRQRLAPASQDLQARLTKEWGLAPTQRL